jgi:hypothetical protein
MAGSGKAENTVNIIIEAGDFQFNDSLEAADGKDSSRRRPRDCQFRVERHVPRVSGRVSRTVF